MSSSSQASPFVSFPVGTALSAPIDVGSGPTLSFLGSSAGLDLYLNRDFASLGLVCSSSTEDLETVVRSLVAAHASDRNARVLILYSQKFVGKRKPCTLINSAARPKVFISPRNPESSTKLYAAAGFKTSPLDFRESALTTQHLLDFFTPPADIQGRNMILNTIQLIISQLREPFDLQHFIEMTEKENWTEDAANFIALRQTILTSLLSSPQSKQPNASPSFDGHTILDLGDPLLRHAGLESIMMDMLLHQFLLDSSGGHQLLVLCNSHEYLSVGSPLSSSLESLATSGSNRTTSIILATTSPSSIPLEYYNSVDYVVYGHGRSSVWKRTLREHFSLEPPKAHRMRGRLMVWSPESQHCGNGNTRDLTKGTSVWEDSQPLIDLSELKRTMPKNYEEPGTVRKHGEGLEIFGADVDSPVRQPLNTASASDPRSLSSSLDSDEEGMIPSSSIRREGGRMPGLHLEVDAVQTPSLETTAAPLMSRVSMADSPPPAKNAKQATSTARDPSAYRPLISAVLRVSNNQPDALVSFEAVRGILGNNAAIKDLGWWTYTTLVEEACQQGIVEVIETRGGFKYIRLSASSRTQATAIAKTPPAVKVAPVMASPLVTSAPSKQALTTSKVDSIIPPTFVTSTTPASTTIDTTLLAILQICPAKHLPLVEVILRLGSNDVQAKVSFDAVGTAVGKTKAEVQARGHGWVSYPQWAQKAHEEGWILQGGFGSEIRWMTLGSKLKPKPIVVASSHSAPKVGTNQSPVGSGGSGETKNITSEPVTGLSASPLSTLTQSTLDQTLATETIPSHSTLEFRSPADYISPITLATIKAAPSLQNPADFPSSITSPGTYLPPSPTLEFKHPHATASVGTRGADRDIGPKTGGNTLITRLISVQSRRVTADSYPPSHRLVVDTMIALGSGSSYIQVVREDLWTALRSRAHGETAAKRTSYVTAAEVSGVLKRFVNDQGKTWFLLENPSHGGGMTAWVRSFMPPWF